jgi:hypothetical protein
MTLVVLNEERAADKFGYFAFTFDLVGSIRSRRIAPQPILKVDVFRMRRV